jgi:hypothetical protein
VYGDATLAPTETTVELATGVRIAVRFDTTAERNAWMVALSRAAGVGLSSPAIVAAATAALAAQRNPVPLPRGLSAGTVPTPTPAPAPSAGAGTAAGRRPTGRAFQELSQLLEETK